MSAETFRTYTCMNVACALYHKPIGLGVQRMGPFLWWPVLVCPCGFAPVILKFDPETGELRDTHGNVIPQRST